ncbi:elongation factor P [Thermosulfurimonas dismutans]|uniref:Elongation factor P n=1 Tax=Thermosulfurimonas dismutans TaxID=999894 RepID=A0A179D3P2_9BACT|nr:elongation factor P [Thermosulfurimonas dismutans]OAQ20248.1 Translation elongation factor P [Thermosulfurimonas dismutans]
MAYTTSDFRRGLKIEWEGKPYEVLEYQHSKVAKGQATVRTKLRDLTTGRVLEVNFRSGERFERPDLEEKEMQYLYQEGDRYVFMDLEDYDQVYLDKDQLGEAWKFLQENVNVFVLYYKGKPIGVELPNTVELKVVETEPGVRGDTVSGGSKPAKLETGAVVQVPLFINEGDLIKVDTRTGEYVERVG